MSDPASSPPYFDILFARLDAGDPLTVAAFGRHVHWGYWPNPAAATGTADDYGKAAERLCEQVYGLATIRDGQEVLDVVYGNGLLMQYDASGAHQLASTVRSVGVSFDTLGAEVLEIVYSNGGLMQYDRLGSQALASGENVVSAQAAFKPSDGTEVLDVMYADGTLLYFNFPNPGQKLGMF